MDLQCSPQLNPDPPSTCIFSFSLSLQHVDSWSLISQSRWKSSWNYVSCRHFLKEWEGCTAHLHKNVILLVRALLKCGQCFFTAVFLAFSMRLYGISIVAPSLSVCLLWIVVVDIRVESTFLSRAVTHDYFNLSISCVHQIWNIKNNDTYPPQATRAKVLKSLAFCMTSRKHKWFHLQWFKMEKCK